MAKTWKLSTALQLDLIRAGLLRPRQLWAAVRSYFEAACVTREPRQRRPAKRKSRWVTADGWQCLAYTRSEARAHYKKSRGPLPVGLTFQRG